MAWHIASFISGAVVGIVVFSIYAMAKTSGRLSREEEFESKLSAALETELYGAREGAWRQ